MAIPNWADALSPKYTQLSPEEIGLPITTPMPAGGEPVWTGFADQNPMAGAAQPIGTQGGKLQPAPQGFFGSPGGQLGLTAIPAAAQIALSAAPTASSRYANQEIRSLQNRRDAGELGLSGSDRALAEQALFSPVRAAAGEAQLRGEAVQASMGGTSAAALVREQREASRRVDDAARQAGVHLFAQHLTKVDQDLRRLEELLEFKARRQADQRAAIVQGVGQLGALAGQVAAAQAAPGVQPTAMTAGLNRQEIRQLQGIDADLAKYGYLG